MNKIRILLVAVFVLVSAGAPRTQAAGVPVVAQVLSFSMLASYITNTIETNVAGTVLTAHHMETVLINSANMSRALTRAAFGTNFTNWGPTHIDWAGSSIVYEQNLASTNPASGIYLRMPPNQYNVSSFFESPYSSNGFAGLFTFDVTNIFGASTNTEAFGPTLVISNTAAILDQGYENTNNGNMDPTLFESINYINFTTPDMAFRLFGWTQGRFAPVVFEGETYKIPQGVLTASGTFKLNLTTNLFDVPNTNSAGMILTNVVPAANYYGILHGTVIFQPPYHLSVESWP